MLVRPGEAFFVRVADVGRGDFDPDGRSSGLKGDEVADLE